MSTYKSDFLNTLSTRGYIHQCSDATGLDALAAIQREHPGLPVVLTSGYTEQDVRSRFPEQAWVDFVQKPFAAAELLRVLRRVLEPAC